MIPTRIAVLLPVLALLVAACPALAQEPPAAAPAKHEVGVLKCTAGPETASDVRDLECTFTPETDRPPETYVGHIEKLADIGGSDTKSEAPTVMTWQVLAAAPNIQVGALAGDYRSDVAPMDTEADAKVYLVGGVDDAIALLPLSEAADQKSLAAVVAQLRLKTVKA